MVFQRNLKYALCTKGEHFLEHTEQIVIFGLRHEPLEVFE